MPELPEVEVVRRGLAAAVPGRTLSEVQVLHLRPLRRHLGGPDDFAQTLVGRTFGEPRRRGKYLWLPFTDGDALLAHLGMSGQFRLDADLQPLPQHCRVIFSFTDGGAQLRFADQRMFGSLAISRGGAEAPDELAHIAPDLLDPGLELASLAARIRTRHSGIKRVLLNQEIVSGVGNIYADEALWLAKVHYDAAASSLSVARITEVLRAAQQVMTAALAAGGTSFDSLYVNVNGSSGYFERSLNAYGREGLPCLRCGHLMVREPFMNRSSFRCPTCQRPPRRAVARG